MKKNLLKIALVPIFLLTSCNATDSVSTLPSTSSGNDGATMTVPDITDTTDTSLPTTIDPTTDPSTDPSVPDPVLPQYDFLDNFVEYFKTYNYGEGINLKAQLNMPMNLFGSLSGTVRLPVNLSLKYNQEAVDDLDFLNAIKAHVNVNFTTADEGDSVGPMILGIMKQLLVPSLLPGFSYQRVNENTDIASTISDVDLFYHGDGYMHTTVTSNLTSGKTATYYQATNLGSSLGDMLVSTLLPMIASGSLSDITTDDLKDLLNTVLSLLNFKETEQGGDISLNTIGLMGINMVWSSLLPTLSELVDTTIPGMGAFVVSMLPSKFSDIRIAFNEVEGKFESLKFIMMGQKEIVEDNVGTGDYEDPTEFISLDFVPSALDQELFASYDTTLAQVQSDYEITSSWTEQAMDVVEDYNYYGPEIKNLTAFHTNIDTLIATFDGYETSAQALAGIPLREYLEEMKESVALFLETTTILPRTGGTYTFKPVVYGILNEEPTFEYSIYDVKLDEGSLGSTYKQAIKDLITFDGGTITVGDLTSCEIKNSSDVVQESATEVIVSIKMNVTAGEWSYQTSYDSHFQLKVTL